MSPELEKVCEEVVQKFETGNWNGTTRFKIEQGFKAAIESEQVQGLVEALEFYSDKTEDGLDWDYVNNPTAIQDRGKVAVQALEKFRGVE